MARDEIFEVAKRKQPAPANFGDDRAPVFPDQVAESLLGQAKHPSGLLVVE